MEDNESIQIQFGQKVSPVRTMLSRTVIQMNRSTLTNFLRIVRRLVQQKFINFNVNRAKRNSNIVAREDKIPCGIFLRS